MLTAYHAAQIYDAEAPALAAGQPLMARAAAALAGVAGDHAGPGGRIVVFAGKGNNGADGLYAAAELAGAGHPTTAAVAFDPGSQPGVTGAALEAARNAGVSVIPARDRERVSAAAAGAGLWVDALSGIGMRPPVRGALGELIAQLSTLRADLRGGGPTVVAADLPSGLGADDGRISGPVLAADHTVTFGGYKTAHFLPPAAHLCGRVELIDIGIGAHLDRSRAAAPGTLVHRVEPADLARAWPRPRPLDHKYTRGVLAVVTGSQEYPGAAVLSVSGALGAGPGMVRYLGDVPGAVFAAHPEAVSQPGRAQAWVIGSGISGRDSSAAPAVEEAIRRAMEAEVPIVVDAGGLQWVEGARIGGFEATAQVILTPHAGELADVLRRTGAREVEGVSRSDIDADPAAWARRAAELTRATVVLKGGATLIASEGALFSQDDGTPWLATAGSGDVLAGVLGTVAAHWQVRRERGAGAPSPGIGVSIAAGVALHGYAGVRASGGGPMTASQVAAEVSPALREVLAD